MMNFLLDFANKLKKHIIIWLKNCLNDILKYHKHNELSSQIAYYLGPEPPTGQHGFSGTIEGG